MAQRKPSRRRDSSLPRGRLGLRRVAGEEFELVHPATVLARKEDLEEVRAMIEAGETEVAVDELRWLSSGCSAFVEGHQLLGELALLEGDYELAQSHLGTAFELGLAALGRSFSGRLPGQRPANRPLFLAGKGLAWAMKQQGHGLAAAQVVDQLLRWDPSDPLHVRGLLTAKEYP